MGAVRLTVTDTGQGMDEATRARMFEPFFTTKPKGHGTGLGLATVLGIVEQSEGRVRVRSAPGLGTTFEIDFPPATGTPLATVRELEPDLTDHGTETVLVVDDEEAVRGVVCRILRQQGYDVLEAQTAGDALFLCERHGARIRLLLTDVVMPRISGRELAERIVTLLPAVRVLYMSGHTDDAVVRHGVLHTDTAFLQKPIRPADLSRSVREVLDRPVRAR